MNQGTLHRLPTWAALILLIATALMAAPASAQSCGRTLTADVVALDQPFFWNRLGAAQPQGQIYALRRDVVGSGGSAPGPGNAMLREGKRPRPLVLRMNAGDCLDIYFSNWLSTSPGSHQPVTRDASIHVVGMQLQSISDDGSWVGVNNSSLVGPGGSTVYRIYAEREGTHLLHSAAAMTGGPEADNGTTSTGLFGAVNVEPAGSTWYRSQVTEEEFRWATKEKKSWPMPGDPYTQKAVHGFPLVDYGATYPLASPHADLPLLQILDGNEIVHSDLNAIIVGGTYESIGVYPNRNEPFREFTIIFHDELGAVQAFPHFYDGDPEFDPDDTDGGLAHTLHSVRDAFAINYGTGGIGSEILANRLGVGPMHDCVNCLYEEFFLSAWAVGDPAMIVDVPANAPCTEKEIKSGDLDPGEPDFCMPTPGPKATQAFYPDDPSNVYHSYLNDHVKFRNLLAGSDDHHIFHLHAHQWLHTPDADRSTYLDSQAIGQGTAFTYEIAHEGSGNRNKTPGDSIFHCHFYPHFAQGMWSMWRTHDVLEIGTPLDQDGRPATGGRALPDGEIAAGTPIPALVPLPGQPMPLPPSVQVSINNGQVVLPATAAGNPGFPFYIPAEAGQRVPAPPLDFYSDASGTHDGGLPRHLIYDGDWTSMETRLDFSKNVFKAYAYELDDLGEPWERQAMAYHADRFDNQQDGFVTTYTPEGSTGLFEVNGTDEVGGAPYSDPCYRPSQTNYPNAKRFLTYKAANIEMDVIFNKKGWHFPQQRFLSLWDDVYSFLDRSKPPEPLFIRANTYDCVEYLHTNLVPKEYELDDFQVRTPTDILGQHIHLVKFDVTSSDGGANGFNYEDGTLSPEEVRHVIESVNKTGGLYACKNCKAQIPLSPKAHPAFPEAKWAGAQTTVQRWYVDNVLNNYNADRTLRTVFTHDHFGPSTHQQVGLYAGLVTEREGSLWYHAEDGTPLGYSLSGEPFRKDGGPTSWQAVIEGPETFREFVLEFGDFQHAYTRDNVGYPDPSAAINPPGRHELWDDLAGSPWIYEKPALQGNRCPDGAPAPCPEAVSAQDPGTMVVNYRNEPIALRVKDPNSNTQAGGLQGDLSWAFKSIARADTDLNVREPNYGSNLNKTEEVRDADPYTPMLRAYEDDEIRIRVLVGAHEEEHDFSLHGTRWLFEPEEANSGWKASQMMGISEFYDFEIPPLLAADPNLAFEIETQQRPVDFLYKAGSSVDDLWNGIWGLIRVQRGTRPDLKELSTNTDGRAADVAAKQETYNGPCPPGADPRPYDVVAISVADSLPGGRILYNDRPRLPRTPLNDPTAIMFVHDEDLEFSPKLKEKYNTDVCAVQVKQSAPVEPLILRAEAGECIQVHLTNCVLSTRNDAGYSLLPNIVDEFNQNQIDPSGYVGLHAQLVTYNVADSDGLNVGRNPIQTVPREQTRSYIWYAGINHVREGEVKSEDVEFGSVPLFSSDPIKHSNKGAVGALIIEPKNSVWTEYPGSRAKAKVGPDPATTASFPEFREFVLITQNDINLQDGDGEPIRPLEVSEDPAETGQSAVNYRTEPVWFREGKDPETLFNIDLANTFSNLQVPSDPEVGRNPKTPLFHAVQGEPVRFRLVHPGGDSQANTWGVHGHVFEETPYTNGSSVIGSNPASEWKGAQYGHGPTNAFDVLPKHGAGGYFGATGDFMWRDHVQWYLSGGIWGIFRVHGSEAELAEEEPRWDEIGPAPGGTVTLPGTATPTQQPLNAAFGVSER